MLAIQLDDARSYGALADTPSALLNRDLIARHPRAAEFRETVASWNGRASADSASYRLVHAFRVAYTRQCFAAITARAASAIRSTLSADSGRMKDRSGRSSRSVLSTCSIRATPAGMRSSRHLLFETID